MVGVVGRRASLQPTELVLARPSQAVISTQANRGCGDAVWLHPEGRNRDSPSEHLCVS